MPTPEALCPQDPLPHYLQEDLTQECRELMSSLPTEQGWVANHLHQYQGFWHTSRQLQAVLACQKNFQAQASDILLVTTPKAGTTWLKAISFALMNRSRYHADSLQHPLLAKNPHVLVPFLEVELYSDNKVPDFSSFEPPRIFSTHLAFNSLPSSVDDAGCKLVYLCRNPKDTFVSFWLFTNKLRLPYKDTNSLEGILDKFCRGVSLSGPFWDHVLDYWKKSLESPERVLFLKYEELKKNPSAQLKKLAEFLGCPFSIEEEKQGVMDQILKLCSFDSLSNLEVNKMGKLPSGEENNAFFRKGEVGDWINYLTPEMAEKIDNITDEKLNGSGLQL